MFGEFLYSINITNTSTNDKGYKSPRLQHPIKIITQISVNAGRALEKLKIYQ